MNKWTSDISWKLKTFPASTGLAPRQHRLGHGALAALQALQHEPGSCDNKNERDWSHQLGRYQDTSKDLFSKIGRYPEIAQKWIIRNGYINWNFNPRIQGLRLKILSLMDEPELNQNWWANTAEIKELVPKKLDLTTKLWIWQIDMI